MEAVVLRENPEKQTPWQRKRILLKTQLCGQGVKALTTKNVFYFIYINHIKSSKNTPGGYSIMSVRYSFFAASKGVIFTPFWSEKRVSTSPILV